MYEYSSEQDFDVLAKRKHNEEHFLKQLIMEQLSRAKTLERVVGGIHEKIR